MICWITVLVAGWLLYKLTRPPPPPAYGAYSQPTVLFYPKMALFWLILTLRKLQARGAHANETRPAGYGVASRSSPEQMERLQTLGQHPQALDAVLIQGAGGDGSWLVAAAARRPHRVVNGILIVSVPEAGTLLLEKHPETTIYGTEDVHGAEGLEITPETAMRRWRVKFNGKMRHHQTGQLVDVDMDLTYRSNVSHFDFDTDMSPWAVARAISREPWSREFFQRLQDAHQTHYEQIGTTSGKVTINGKTYNFSVTGMRDHSYAHRRDWTLLHRYGLHTLILEDGTRAQVGIVSQPCTFSRIELGYLYTPDGKLHPLDWCDLELPYHGEGGTPPVQYGLRFHAGGRTYSVQVEVQESHTVYIGWLWEARVLERRCTYNVDGLKGHGVSEWYYRHHGGRQQKYVDADPAWVKDIAK